MYSQDCGGIAKYNNNAPTGYVPYVSAITPSQPDWPVIPIPRDWGGFGDAPTLLFRGRAAYGTAGYLVRRPRVVILASGDAVTLWPQVLDALGSDGQDALEALGVVVGAGFHNPSPAPTSDGPESTQRAHPR